MVFALKTWSIMSSFSVYMITAMLCLLLGKIWPPVNVPQHSFFNDKNSVAKKQIREHMLIIAVTTHKIPRGMASVKNLEEPGY